MVCWERFVFANGSRQAFRLCPPVFSRVRGRAVIVQDFVRRLVLVDRVVDMIAAVSAEGFVAIRCVVYRAADMYFELVFWLVLLACAYRLQVVNRVPDSFDYFQFYGFRRPVCRVGSSVLAVRVFSDSASAFLDFFVVIRGGRLVCRSRASGDVEYRRKGVFQYVVVCVDVRVNG